MKKASVASAVGKLERVGVWNAPDWRDSGSGDGEKRPAYVAGRGMEKAQDSDRHN